MNKDMITAEYKAWIFSIVRSWLEPYGSYEKLIENLYNTEFIAVMHRDENRKADGKDLLLRFTENMTEYNYRDAYLYLWDRPCSVLEMMVALALRCEENIMSNSNYGDRSGQWFTAMLSSLELNDQTDDNYDEEYVNAVIDRFTNRKYDKDGRGGLFTTDDPAVDMRKMEIWYQLMQYLSRVEDVRNY